MRHESQSKTKMIQISRLPFEIQDIIFELKRSMLIYVVNMLVKDSPRSIQYGYYSLKETCPPSKQVVQEIASSCPLAYTCSRSRAAVFRRLHRLIRVVPDHGLEVSPSILKYVHITVRLRDMVKAKDQVSSSHSFLRRGSSILLGLSSFCFHESPFVPTPNLESWYFTLPYQLKDHVDRVDAEWWWDRDTGVARTSPLLGKFMRSFPRATHLTVTPEIVDDNYRLQKIGSEAEELEIMKLREWERYTHLQTQLRLLCARKGWTWLSTYTTKDFPLPMFEIKC